MADDPLSWAIGIWNFFSNIGLFFLQLLGFKIVGDTITPPNWQTFLNNLVILVITVFVAYFIVKYILKLI